MTTEKNSQRRKTNVKQPGAEGSEGPNFVFLPGGVKSADECQLSAHMREALIFPGVHTGGCLFGCECDVQGAQETDSS